MVESRLAALNAQFTPSQITVTIKDRVAVVEITPPTKLVFLGTPLMEQMQQTFQALEEDPQVSVAIITGNKNSFAVGADIKELERQTINKHMFADYFERVWFRVVPKFRKPLIAAVNGMAFGGGLELAMMADIMLASENAKFGQPEINLGIIPGAGGTVRLPQAVGKSKAMEMILTGEPIGAQDALKWGLVSQVFPSQEKLMEGAMALATKIASKSQIAASFAKRSVKNSFEVGENSAMDHERSLFVSLMATQDKQEGTSAFGQKRKPKWADC